MIPVIDFEQGNTYRVGQLGKENFWEWIFKQECSVKEALKGGLCLCWEKQYYIF
jgi:hypothetical protein